MNLESYDNLIKKISDKCILEFKQLEAVYNFDIGDELEMALVTMLREFLPAKYGVVRGFVVDKDGNKAGDDIIIFDQQNFPTLRFLNKDNIFLKQQVPIEAVLAYIEVKNTLDDVSYLKAVKQVKDVKNLCYKRSLKMYEWLPFEEKKLFSNEYNTLGYWEPTIKNPVYGMIFSRYSVDKDGKRITESSAKNNGKVYNFANFTLEKYRDEIDDNSFLNPDSIIFGDSNVAICSGKYIDKKGNERLGITRFYAGIKEQCQYQIKNQYGNSYGIALAHLMMALNFIKLIEMPWENIFGCPKNYEDSDKFVEVEITDLIIKE